jgi:hypothetical protein
MVVVTWSNIIIRMTIILVLTRILEMYTLYTTTGLPELDRTCNLPLYQPLLLQTKMWRYIHGITAICCTRNATPNVELKSALNTTRALLFLQRVTFWLQNLTKINHMGDVCVDGE